MELELRGNVMSLAGEDISTGVTQAQKLEPAFAVLQTLLRDTLVLQFDLSFEQGESCLEVNELLEPAMHAMLRLAVILTADNVA